MPTTILAMIHDDYGTWLFGYLGYLGYLGTWVVGDDYNVSVVVVTYSKSCAKSEAAPIQQTEGKNKFSAH